MMQSICETRDALTEHFGYGNVEVIGTRCTMTDLARLSSALHDHADRSGEVISVDFTNVHIVTMRRHENDFAGMTESVDLFVPDSTILTWCARLLGGRGGERIYGPWFMEKFIRSCPDRFTHYFLGGSEELLSHLVEEVDKLRSGIRIVGAHHGYLDEAGADDAAIVADINAKSPDFIWVGMGTPRQQRWIDRNKGHISRGALLAVGFAFDVNARMKSDAPEWMQKAGLTWLFRLWKEPARLGPRYLRYNLLFLRYFSAQMASVLLR